MQPQALSTHEAARRAWDGLASLRRRTDIGPAVLLAYHELWFSLGCRPGCYDLTLSEFAAACGRTHRAAAKWLDELVALGLVEVVANDSGRIRVYVAGPGDADMPRRLAEDPQRALPGFDEAQPEVTHTEAMTVPRGGSGGTDLSAEADLLVPKGPDLLAQKGPPESDDGAALAAALSQRRQALGIAIHAPPERLGGGPFGTKRSELELRALQFNNSTEELRALELAKRSAAGTVGLAKPAAAPPAGVVDRVVARADNPDAAANYRRRRDGLVAEITGRIPAVRQSVARNVVDGVLNKLFAWDDVERMLDAADAANVPWQYFVGAAKQKYRDVCVRWPGERRKGAAT